MKETMKTNLQHAMELSEKSDVKALFSLVKDSEEEKEKMLKALDGLVEHYATRNKSPRLPDIDSVNAIKEIALAAIGLASLVVRNNGDKKPQPIEGELK